MLCEVRYGHGVWAYAVLRRSRAEFEPRLHSRYQIRYQGARTTRVLLCTAPRVVPNTCKLVPVVSVLTLLDAPQTPTMVLTWRRMLVLMRRPSRYHCTKSRYAMRGTKAEYTGTRKRRRSWMTQRLQRTSAR
eukprot:231116-Rhodomonas_salina.1